MRQILPASMMGEFVGSASVLTRDDASMLTKQKQHDSPTAGWLNGLSSPASMLFLSNILNKRCQMSMGQR